VNLESIKLKPLNEQIKLINNMRKSLDELLDEYFSIENDRIRIGLISVIVYCVFLSNKHKLEILKEELRKLQPFWHIYPYHEELILTLINIDPYKTKKLLDLLKELNNSEVDRYEMILETVMEGDYINKELEEKINHYNEMNNDDKIKCLEKILFSLLHVKISKKVSPEILSQIEVTICRNKYVKGEMELICKIIPNLMKRIHIEDISYKNLIDQCSDNEYQYFLVQLMSYKVNPEIFFNILHYGIDKVVSGQLSDIMLHHLGLELCGIMNWDFNPTLTVNFVDKLLKSGVYVSENIFYCITSFPKEHRLALMQHLPKLIIELDDNSFFFIPQLMVNLFRDDNNSFLDQWLEIDEISLKRKLDMLNGYFVPIYEEYEKYTKMKSNNLDIPDNLKTRIQTSKEFLQKLSLILEKILVTNKVDVNKIYRGGKRNIFSIILLQLWYLSLNYYIRIDYDIIQENYQNSTYIKKYIDKKWLEEKISSSEKTHFLMYLLSIKENFEITFFETILKEIDGKINLEDFFNRIKSDYLSYFDVLSELSLLSIFLSQKVRLRIVEYELSNGKFLDFLLEKENNQILIEVMNIRPYGPLEHLMSAWEPPNLAKSAVIKKIRSKLGKITKETLPKIPIVFAFDATKISQSDIIETVKGSLGFEVIFKEGERYARIKNLPDSIFHENIDLNLLSGILWFKRDYNINKVSVQFLKLNSTDIPSWFMEIISKAQIIFPKKS